VATSTGTRNRVPQQGGNDLLERWFRIKERGSSVATEGRGGVVTFMTMSYIIVLNPLIMGFTKDSTGHYLGGGLAPNLAAVAVATAVVAGVSSIAMGAYANYPLALATGLGLNAYVTFNVATASTWADAMGLIVIEGIVMAVLTQTGFREKIFQAVPLTLRKAISVGIGLFLTFIAVFDSGISRAGVGIPVQLGPDGTLRGWPALVFIIGLMSIAVMLVKKVRGGILLGIIGATGLAIVIQNVAKVGSQTDATGKLVNPAGWSLNVPAWPDSFASKPDFGSMFHISLTGAFSDKGVLWSLVVIFTMLLSNVFDTMGTMTAIGDEAGLLDENGTPPNVRRIFLVDSLAGSAGGAGGVSSATAYIESASGVGEGARTGLSSIVVGVLFLGATVVAPLAKIVPYEAATPALVIVGFLMMRQVKDIDWDDYEVAIPAFLTMVLMPFTYSISVGVGAGFVSYTLIKLLVGKGKQVHVLMYVVSAAFVIYFALDVLKAWFGIS
jgi:AGZA family xanthine/uracil permease-like MFS transporter